MGRTVLPVAQIIRQEQEEWSKFRRVLRKKDQLAFDELFALAKYHSAALAYASRAIPLESVFMSVLLEHQKMIAALRERLEKMEDIPNE